ncbi:NAD(P)-dependent alcohol dehydrogenase [Actinomadura rupiterrae]|uniref:NAD(P)-dependent alcohol dehydrogenase n=1 Tax=Actinomadura rupiterrae TaxID=559627 RepID=UPI0020A442E6|nr:NAD(P)-dependent alcohol dehydrogenase [Actinomadura rupiterrae]MCP2343051.1 aryl-alcohol dehydrogenase [Actinomadura rupiterrae]
MASGTQPTGSLPTGSLPTGTKTAGNTVSATAAVLRGHDAPYSLEPVELAEPGPGEVLVRIAGAGMCHTDLLGRVPGDRVPKPVVLGHEGSGHVEAIGPGASGLAVGDPVVLSFDSCGQCRNCHDGRPGYCAGMARLNMAAAAMDGRPRAFDKSGQAVHNRWFGQSSFATHALATVRNTVKVDEDLPIEMLGPLGCGVQTGVGSVLLALAVRPGESLVVFGAGAVGLSAVMAARLTGAAPIVAVDLLPARRDLALELGATHALDGAAPDLGERLRAVVRDGFHHALDTTARPDAVATALAALRTTGVCGLVGVGTEDYRLDPTLMLMGRTVRGIIEGDAVPQTLVPRMTDLWRRGLLPFDRLIQTYPLADIARAEADALSGTTVKPVLLP